MRMTDPAIGSQRRTSPDLIPAFRFGFIEPTVRGSCSPVDKANRPSI
jgi:hypothetical protein